MNSKWSNLLPIGGTENFWGGPYLAAKIGPADRNLLPILVINEQQMEQEYL